MNYEEFFKKATKNPEPYPYQRRLATGKELPQLLDVPTGCGKTAAVVLAWLWRRRYAEDEVRKSTPRRLVYCLPMRVLVEQTKDNCLTWLNNLGILGGEFDEDGYSPSWDDSSKINVTVLMGGEDRDEWDLHPEMDAIIIGTQDMLLSRALNRGYGMSKYRWPMHFGLLNNDCLWVMDEVQLMGNGLATTTQMQGFREQLGVMQGIQSIWMSATTNPQWLETVDFKLSKETPHSLDEEDIGEKEGNDKLKRKFQSRKVLKKTDFYASKDGKKETELVLKIHNNATRTLVIVNTVRRAQLLFNNIKKKKPDADVVLIHSRFRENDRKEHFEKLMQEPGRNGIIGLTTQVIEAGVDVSASTLVTDLAPWPSMVQRMGRCNRNGEFNPSRADGIDHGEVHWIPVEKTNPYDEEDLRISRERLEKLSEVGPNAIPKYLDPMEHVHVIRKRDIIDLFDTTPDLAGADIDVSRFIREADEYHVQVFWRDIPKKGPEPDEPGPAREELCSVPINDITKNGKLKFDAYRWNHLEKNWDKIQSVYPGLVMMIDRKIGGYNSELGWNGKENETAPCEAFRKIMSHYDGDRWSQSERWETIAEHTDAVVNEVDRLIEVLNISKFSDHLKEAARWHDIGKAHPVFQNAIPETKPSNDLFGKVKDKMSRYERPGFRHELVTALIMLNMGKTDLSAYLAGAHHGKVRLSIRSLPIEKKPDNDPERLFARGVWDGDVVPSVYIGNGITVPETVIKMNYMQMGDDDDTGPSWLSRMLVLRDAEEIGPFRLTYLETILRVSDWRGSANNKSKEES